MIELNKDVVLLQRLISYPTRFGLVLRSSLYIIILVTSKWHLRSKTDVTNTEIKPPLGVNRKLIELSGEKKKHAEEDGNT